MYKIEIDKFSGPLDLLLQLIEQRELDVSQVSLAEVTDQYLSYIEDNCEISAIELADFLVVATKLLVIKSRILLPQMADEEEDSAEELEKQLKIYKDYLEASKVIEKMIGENNFCFTREKIAVQLEPIFSPPPEVSAEDLKGTFLQILERIDYVVNLPQKVMEKSVSLREMVSKIKDSLQRAGKISFNNILTEAKSRTDVVVCFMALLELIKTEEIAVIQKGIFDDIEVKKVL